MRDTELHIANESQQMWQNSSWYRALTLKERYESLQLSTTDEAASGSINDQVAAKKFQRWKEQKPFNQGTYFVERLAIDHLTEKELYRLLGEPIEAVQARIAVTPDWLLELAQAFETLETSDQTAFMPKHQGARANMGIVDAIEPLLRNALRRLQRRIEILSQEQAYLPFDAQSVIEQLFMNLQAGLIFRLDRVIALELNVARLQGHLQGDTAEERFQDFIRSVGQRGGLLPILEEYPVLARQLVIAIDNWINFGIEFLHHLCSDWEQICATFSPERDPGKLVELQGGAGDAHRRGRSVLKLKFSSGLQLVYKPKSLAVDVHFQELLSWLNARGKHAGFRTVQLLDRGTYGWSEFVTTRGCSTAEEIARFYERQGGYLALLYALEATDFHFENLIAEGEHPVLIDLEALFHPRIRGTEAAPAVNMLLFSVMRVGLLPQRARLNEQAEGVDLSGLGGHHGQLSPHPVIRWEGLGTDQMHLVRQRIEMPGKDNRPRLNGNDVDILNYQDSIMTGFAKIYRLLMEHRDELLAGPIARFAHDEIRLIVRPTNLYGRLLLESYHPDLLRDALDRDRFFDHLWADIDQQSHLIRLISSERNDLFMGDIPMFTSYPDSTDAYSTQGERIDKLFDTPSLEFAKRCIQRLDESDLARQSWFIKASLATITMGTGQAAWKATLLQPSQTNVTRERLLEEACKAGDRLCDIALQAQDEIGWLGLTLIEERHWMLLPTGHDLYSGSPGIILFLSYLGLITGTTRYTTVAKAALETLYLQIESVKDTMKLIGGFDGWGGLIYLFTHLGMLWNSSELLNKAQEIVDLLPDYISTDKSLDVISGSAGCILSLLSLYQILPSKRILDVALLCGEHLLSHASPMKEGSAWITPLAPELPLTGYSHGAAGIAWSLLKLAHFSGEERFRLAAMEAMTYERSTFSPEQQNWPDLRPPELFGLKNSQEISYLTVWCHGAPGIGLSRLASLKYCDTATIREEIQIALDTTIAQGFGLNHSLCHGDLGNLDILLIAAQILNDSQLNKKVKQLTAMILDSITANGWSTGIPLGVESPGLMTGLAGIGYELLRLAEPVQVPSVLLLDPPFIYDGR